MSNENKLKFSTRKLKRVVRDCVRDLIKNNNYDDLNGHISEDFVKDLKNYLEDCYCQPILAELENLIKKSVELQVNTNKILKQYNSDHRRLQASYLREAIDLQDDTTKTKVVIENGVGEALSQA